MPAANAGSERGRRDCVRRIPRPGAEGSGKGQIVTAGAARSAGVYCVPTEPRLDG